MTVSVKLRPLRVGEFSEARDPESEFSDFGPSRGRQSIPPCRMDEAGMLAVEAAGELAGYVTWEWREWGPNQGSRCAMLGIWLDSDFRGRALAVACVTQLSRLIFRHTLTNRVEAHTDIENFPAQKVLEKAGFIQEGVIRGAQWRNGRFRDGLLYSLLRDECGI